MSFPIYVSPEQMMQDKAEYARKGIGKARPSIVMEYAGGILLLAENHSPALHKICEIYDRIAFVGAGKYSEFENLRRAGIRYADLKGYTYGREDVTARSLANAYSQAIGEIFSQQVKPLEVEIAVAQVGEVPDGNEVYRISFDGSIADEKGFCVIGGQAEELVRVLRQVYEGQQELGATLEVALQALEQGTEHKPELNLLEVAVLERERPGRKFRFMGADDLRGYLKLG
jgi:proteasome alpha subunit